MAAALIRVMNGVDSNESASAGKSTAPITRDLLGGCCTFDSNELDLELQAPSGWEKRLDLKSGKVYFELCNSSNSASSNSENNAEFSNENLPNFQDLNFPPSSKQMFDDSSLDLKLVPLSSSPANYQSVCTLDKVKSALERAEKESFKKCTMSMSPPSNSSASFAAGCPCCFLYVLISKNDPKCPRCNSDVPLPVDARKLQIDLNLAI